MSIIIDGIDFENLEAEKYWSFPSTYKGNKQEEMKNMIFSNTYGGARKMDGAYFRLIRGMNGEVRLQSRSESVNGGYLDKKDWVPQLTDFFERIPKGSCLLGEIYFPKNEGSRHVTTIMGCLPQKARDRQEKGEKLHYYVFDVWAWNGRSYLNMKAEDRFQLISTNFNNSIYQHPYVEWAMYYIGPALWDELEKVREANGEGIVITKLDSVPAPGKRTARKTLKIKKELDNPVDCFLTGKWKPATKEYKGKEIEEWPYWFDMRTLEKKKGYYYKEWYNGESYEPVNRLWYNGWAAAIEIAVIKDGAEFPIGWISGIDDSVREGITTHPEDYTHRVVKVNGMSIEPDTHKLRHGKIIEWRAPGDKSWEECSMEQFL